GVLLLVAEAEHVGRGELGADLAQFARVEEGLEPGPRPDRAMEGALRADLEVLLQLRPVQHRAAALALLPQPLGHAALARRSAVGADARRHQFLQPAHAWSAPIEGPLKRRSLAHGPVPPGDGRGPQSRAARSGARKAVARREASAASAA